MSPLKYGRSFGKIVEYDSIDEYGTVVAVEDIAIEGDGVKSERREGAVYDLQGRRLGSFGTPSLPKGIYVIDGRKVVR